MINKLIITIVLITSFLLFPNVVLASNASFKVGDDTYSIDTIQYTMDTAPFIKDDRVFIPLRYIAIAGGVSPQNIKYDTYEKTVKIIKDDGIEIKLRIGDNHITIDGMETPMDVYPEIINDRVCLPIRYITLAFGQKIDWNSEFQVVNILNPLDYKIKAKNEESNDHYGTAIDYYNKWLEISPKDHMAFYSRGEAQYQINLYNDCIESCKKANELKPQDYYYELSARARYKIFSDKGGDKEDILKDMQTAIDISSTPQYSYEHRASLYIRLKEYDNAMSDCEKAIKIDAEYRDAYYIRACAVFEKSGKEAFKEELGKILEKYPDDEWAKSFESSLGENFYIRYPFWE